MNGNILNLSRRGEIKSSTSWTLQQIDKLTYSYRGNQLQAVSDAAPAAYKSFGFKDGNPSGVDYSYDLNGNMVTDHNKGLKTVEYNYLNLPEKLIGDDDKFIHYIYDANGQKLMKRDPKGIETFYAGSFVYKGNSLDYILHSESVYQVAGTNGNSGYQYNVTDHLGNVRLVVNSSGTVTDQSDYYPFGMLMTKKFSGGINNLYKYNGKELQEDVIGKGNLDWYDYGFRMYDPAIARWYVIDGYAEIYYSWSPYNYVLGNPINLIDWLGLDPVY